MKEQIKNLNISSFIQNKLKIISFNLRLQKTEYWLYKSITSKTDAKIEEINYEKLSDINEYIEILEEELKPSEKRMLHNNLLSLNIKKSKIICYLNNATGLYNLQKNKITYATKKAIIHELLHMSSSYSVKGINYGGFEQELKKYTIGTGLNEGYTELLATRIINKNNKPDSYHELVKLAYLLELFFENEEEMRKLYFNHDIFSFIRYMKKYTTEEEIINFIVDMDKIEKNSDFFPIISFLISLKLHLQLKKWYEMNIKDLEKQKQFNKIISKNAFFMKY